VEAGLRRILLAALPLLAPAPALAQEAAPSAPPEQVIEPQIERREVDIDAIDTEDFEVGVFGGFLSIEDFGSDFVYGARLAYHITEDFFVEGAFGMSQGGETSFEVLSGAPPILSEDDRDYIYYNVSLGYNIFPGEAFMGSRTAFTSAFYLIGGAGSTNFGGDDRFTINFGFGYRLLLNDAVAIHADFRDHIFDSDILGEEKTTHNLEGTLGVTIFF
jgi:outer membrane beta-barrel protein